MKEQIMRLTEFPAPAGSEGKLAQYLLSLVEAAADETYVDTLGNAIAKRAGQGPQVLLTAHMDEPGVVVMHIDENGFLRFVIAGALTPNQLVGRQVLFTNGTRGVIQAEDTKDALTVEKLFIDVGADSEAAAKERSYIGLAGIVPDGINALSDDLLTGRALDNRVGCAIAVETFKQVAAAGRAITLAFTAQETVGSRGGRTVAHQIQPDWALVIDGVAAGDAPGAKRMEVKLGKGPAVKIMDKTAIVPLAIKNHLVNTANKEGIDIQYEVWPEGTSDMGAIQLSTSGVATGGISYPVRYAESTSPTVHLQDIENCVKLAVKAIVAKS